MLASARRHLGMEIAFISEFAAGDRVFRYVDADGPCGIQAGDGGPLEDSYCQRVVDGRLPGVITDARALPAARELPVTEAFPVGAHISVPIVLQDGAVYGTFCCFSTRAEPSLNQRDLEVLRVFADLASQNIEQQLREKREGDAAIGRVRRALEDEGQLRMVFQPVIGTADHALHGVEALARFPLAPQRGPDVWFAEAASVGLGVDLELRAVLAALPALDELPEGVFLAVNVSPQAVLSGRVGDSLSEPDLSRVVFEMTEHAPIADYQELNRSIAALRERGARIAVDDAGAGYASFRHILWLEPEFIKLDMSITHGLHTDPARTALAGALIGFASSVGSQIIAEGVEEEAELTRLASLGAGAAQGYFLARPGQLHEVLKPFLSPLSAER
jgi:EAL domain-containing protein (putative c-di-GMP-specific phosphodiesterase class I)